MSRPWAALFVVWAAVAGSGCGAPPTTESQHAAGRVRSSVVRVDLEGAELMVTVDDRLILELIPAENDTDEPLIVLAGELLNMSETQHIIDLAKKNFAELSAIAAAGKGGIDYISIASHVAAGLVNVVAGGGDTDTVECGAEPKCSNDADGVQQCVDNAKCRLRRCVWGLCVEREACYAANPTYWGRVGCGWKRNIQGIGCLSAYGVESTRCVAIGN